MAAYRAASQSAANLYLPLPCTICGCAIRARDKPDQRLRALVDKHTSRPLCDRLLLEQEEAPAAAAAAAPAAAAPAAPAAAAPVEEEDELDALLMD